MGRLTSAKRLRFLAEGEFALICFRCGSDVPEAAPQCPNCGQRFAGARRTFTTTTTSFRALEKRRLRAAKVAETLPFAIGDVVRSRYEVRDLVGRGPLGVVYRVHDQEIEVDVALKVFDASLIDSDESREAFRRTIRKVRKLSQQNIVRIYDEDQDGDRLFYTMQLLEGLTLRKVIGLRQEKGSRFTAREIEPILGQICMALSHAHRHTAHGDLKPENVLILPDVLKLTDFGMFEAVPRDRFVAAQEDAGTARYLAPELRDEGPIDARADVFSLGALFYELLTGKPFAEGAPPPSVVLEMPEEAGADGVDGIVARATATRPEDRYESAEAFSEALSTYVDAQELGSVDVSMVGAPSLLPEDVTRKVKVPAGLQDEPGEDLPTTERPKLPPAATLPAATPFSELTSEPPAERSYIEELDADDLDAVIDEAGESVDIPAVPASRVGPPSDLGPRSATPPPVRETTPIGPPPPAVRARSEPWFLRSNLGFVLAVVVLVGGVLAGTLYLIDVLRSDRDAKDGPLVVQVEGGGVSAPPSEPQVLVVAAEPVKAVPDAATVAAPTTEAAPSTEAAPPPTSVAAVRSEPEAVKPAPATEARAVRTPAPATEAKALVAERPPVPTPAATESAASRPEPKAVAEVKAPADKPVAGVVRATEPEPIEPPVVAAAGGSDSLACLGGMLLITKAAFPKGSVKGGKVSGAEGVALAKAGKAYCLDAYEFPGRGSKPRANVTFTAAEGLCKQAGKRLCSDDEWRRACRGPGGADFPYGGEFDAGRCNTEDESGSERSIEAGGKFSRCRSAVGAYDMSGNVAEWTADQTVRGGDAASADEDAACSAGGRRAPGSARPSIGFRCCADLR